MGATYSCLYNYPIFDVLEGSKQVSAKMNGETKENDYDDSYHPTWNIKITESVSFSNINIFYKFIYFF
jgi:hypothetical protein